MADRSTQLLLDGLERTLADPSGVPLHGTKTAPSLFPTTSIGKQTAQRCKDLGYLRPVQSETKGKKPLEICALTEKGLDYLVSQVGPKRLLEDLVRAIEARHAQLHELVSTARQTQATLDALKVATEKVLQYQSEPTPGHSAATNGSSTWPRAMLSCLAQWHATRNSEDCPLPELFRQSQETAPGLTIGRFHDALRLLHAQEQIYLHPWTGPLYDLPEPAFALLAGHEIVYYASLRR
jgi:hypothetical protein